MTRWLIALVLAAMAAPCAAQDAGAPTDEAPAPLVEPVEEDEAETMGTPIPREEPMPAPRPVSSSASRVAPPPTVIVRRDSDDDEEEPEPDPGDPYDILWIELFGGASYVDMRAIQATDYFPEIVRLAGWGPAGGIAAGFRIEFFSLGVRAALARYDASTPTAPDAVFDVGTATIEAKLALPVPVVQPFVRVGFGLGWHGDSNVEQTWTAGMVPMDFSTTVFGWVFQGAIGLDVYLAHWFAIGAAFSVDLLNMSRQPIENATDVTLMSSGDAIGAQLRGQAAVSFHF